MDLYMVPPQVERRASQLAVRSDHSKPQPRMGAMMQLKLTHRPPGLRVPGHHAITPAEPRHDR
jgi:hypothetical protein